MSRRAALGVGGAAVLATTGGAVWWRWTDDSSATVATIGPGDPAVAAVEESRSRTGRVVTRTLRPAPARIDLGGREVATWAYDGQIPGDAIHVTAGDELRVRLANGLPAPTTVHWHGLALRNDMDGVPDLTQEAITPQAQFEYRFVVPEPGTYWFHPHVGTQLDTGLYAPLVVADPAEPGNYDEEVVLVLDDWTDGWGASPDSLLDQFRSDGMGMDGMDGMDGMGMPSADEPLGGDTGDVAYPAHLVNGRRPEAPVTIRSRSGRRIRFRLINAGSDTAYRFAVGDHRLTVTHSDGFPTLPVEVDSLIIGMGERYDVVVTAGDGVFPIVAAPEGKTDPVARALLRTSGGEAPPPGVLPVQMQGRLLSYDDLTAPEDFALGRVEPDRELDMVLTMGDEGRRWLINDKVFDDSEPALVAAGERVRIRLRNKSMMFHPMHLHGHTFAVSRADGLGVRKDNLNVLPMQEVSIDLRADNPGRWLFHCHNLYHAELGMMTTMSYRA